MILFKKVTDTTDFIARQRANGKTIGFVPTMGALHAGHISLLDMCKLQSDICVCSIFINPTQFNDPKDFNKYPVTISSDILQLTRSNCDVLFLPVVDEIYPEGLGNDQDYAIGPLENILEGAYRPGHFRGVSQVVHRLLNIVKPDKLYLGQKDYQQVLVIRNLVDKLHDHVEVVVSPTKREPSGLAMSSRNMRLNEDDRANAAAIHNVLTYIKDRIADTPIEALKETGKNMLLKAGFTKIDYIEVADEFTLQPIKTFDNKSPVVVLIAAFLKDVRLIDNLVIKPSPPKL